MAVIGVVLAAALLGAAIAGIVAWRLPDFDPAAPRVKNTSIVEDVADGPRFRAFVHSRLDVATATGLALTVALAIVLVALIAVGSLLVMIQHNAGLARYDLSAAKWGGAHATSGSTRFLHDVTFFGGTPAMILISVVVALAEYVRTRKFAVFGFLAVVVIGEVIIQNVTKLIVNRSRPDIHRLTGFSGSSFPSGHAMTAAAVFAAIALLLGRGRSRRTKALLAAGATGIAVAVAATRVLLGVHWFTDVIAGLAMGWAWFAISSIAFGGRILAFGQPVEVAQQADETLPDRGVKTDA